MEITRNIKIEDSFINEPDKYRHEIRETADQWYDKILTYASDIRHLRIEKDLETILKKVSIIIDFASISINDDGDIIETNLEINKQEIKALAYLFEDMMLLLTDEEYVFKFITAGTKDRWNIMYKSVFRYWRDEYKIKMKKISINNIISESHRETKIPAYLEDKNNAGLSEKRAEQILDRLKEKKFIANNCRLEDFRWYFCGKQARKNNKRPNHLKWDGNQNEFAYFCSKLCGSISKDIGLSWSIFNEIFENKIKDDKELNWKSLTNILSKIRCGKDSLKRKGDLDYIFE